MRYSLEPHYRRYVQGQGFMSFDRIMEETQEIIIPPEKREQIIRDLKLF